MHVGVPRILAGLGGECLAEFLGTFVLIAFGCGSVAVAVAGLPGSGRQADAFGPANWLIIAFGWGFAVAFGVYICGGVSGAHLNPAVTLAFALRRGFSWAKVPAYWLAQLVGAFAAAALVYAVYRPAINAYNLDQQRAHAHRRPSTPSPSSRPSPPSTSAADSPGRSWTRSSGPPCWSRSSSR